MFGKLERFGGRMSTLEPKTYLNNSIKSLILCNDDARACNNKDVILIVGG